jgi:hypothetical protein
MITNDGESDDRGPVINIEEVLNQLRSGGRDRQDVSTASSGSVAAPRSRRVFDDRVYRALHQARLLSGRPPAAQRVEYRTAVIGAAWAVVRRRIHQEIQVHIDSLTRHQISFNSQIARALTHLVDDLDQMDLKSGADDRVSQAQAIADLVNQVRELTERVQSLETRLNQTGERTTGGKSDQ